MNSRSRLTLTLAFSAFALSAAADAAGINTSRSNARNSGATATDCPRPSTRAADFFLQIEDEKPAPGASRRQGSNRGYVVGNGGTARSTDITVNEEGLEGGAAPGSGCPAGAPSSSRDPASGLATGRRQSP